MHTLFCMTKYVHGRTLIKDNAYFLHTYIAYVNLTLSNVGKNVIKIKAILICRSLFMTDVTYHST